MNTNKITCLEAHAWGLKTNIKNNRPAYACMMDRGGDVVV